TPIAPLPVPLLTEATG
nr:N14a=14 kda endocuticle protein {N-terminal} [Gecarcinus lateralis=Bermuda land crabs, exoskeleton, Peptide Partial, 16 aa] [Gecarcinus lateralis]